MHTAWTWPSDYRADLFGVRGNSSLEDDEAEEHNLGCEEAALLRMGVKLLLSKCIEYLSQVLMMGVSSIAIYQYVVEVYYDTLADEWV